MTHFPTRPSLIALQISLDHYAIVPSTHIILATSQKDHAHIIFIRENKIQEITIRTSLSKLLKHLLPTHYPISRRQIVNIFAIQEIISMHTLVIDQTIRVSVHPKRQDAFMVYIRNFFPIIG